SAPPGGVCTNSEVVVAGVTFTLTTLSGRSVCVPVAVTAPGRVHATGLPEMLDLDRSFPIESKEVSLSLWDPPAGKDTEYVHKLVFTDSTVGSTGGDTPLLNPMGGWGYALIPRTGYNLAETDPVLHQTADYLAENGFSVAVSDNGTAISGTIPVWIDEDAAAAYEAGGGGVAYVMLNVSGEIYEVTIKVYSKRNPQLVAHEVGHALGLHHSNSPEDMMFHGSVAEGPSADIWRYTPAELDTLHKMRAWPTRTTWPGIWPSVVSKSRHNSIKIFLD
ncbi:MAG: matrixin family metalloprotease, partial [Candidatus Liptonbacteria bacterium]